MKTPHKHAEVSIAWLNDQSIKLEFKHPGTGTWHDRYQSENPISYPHLEWRIKPEPKPEPVLFYSVKDYDDNPDVKAPKVKWTGSRYDSNLHLTFHAETGKLIKAEVI